MLTNGLHGVSLLYQKLGSGDVNVHAERLLLFVNWLCWTCVFTEKHKQKLCVINSVWTTVLCSYWDICHRAKQWSCWTVLPHEHLSQTFCIWKANRKSFHLLKSIMWQKQAVTYMRNTVKKLPSPRSLLSLCSLLLLLSTSNPMKITTMPTNTQEMVTIIFKPSPPPELSSLTLGAFTKGAMVPVQRSYVMCYDTQYCVWMTDII